MRGKTVKVAGRQARVDHRGRHAQALERLVARRGEAPGEQSKRRHRRRPNPRVFSASRRVEGKNQLPWPERGQRRRTNRCVKLLFSRW